MGLSDDLALLSNVSLFEGFPAEQLRMLAFGSRRKFLRAGEILFSEGSPSDGGYVIATGAIDLLIFSKGKQVLIAQEAAGSLIGEAALVIANVRPVEARARTDCELLFLPRDLFLRMLEEYPELAALMHNRLSEAVTAMMAEIRDVHARMASIPDLASGEGEAGDQPTDHQVS